MLKTALVLGAVSYGRPFCSLGYKLKPVFGYSMYPQGMMYKPEDVDLVIFTGGHDINPRMYHSPVNGAQGWNDDRDSFEQEWFGWAMQHKIPMAGICRGLQFFTVMTGGTLRQHVEGHYQHHKILTDKGEVIPVNSIHHQTCLPQDGTCKVLARSYPHADDDPSPLVVEAAYFHEVRALGVQWHPEMMNPACPATLYFNSIFKEYISP